jgi:hypothetical protein
MWQRSAAATVSASTASSLSSNTSRDLSAYALRAQGLVLMAAPTPPVLAADLEHGLKRLKLRAVRQLAPEVLATAKTQRWTPEELLRTLVKTIEEFQLPASSIPNPTFNYLASLEWIDAAENVVLVGLPSRLVEEIPDEGAGCEPSSPRPDTGIRGNPAFLAGHVASYSSLGPTNAPGSWWAAHGARAM